MASVFGTAVELTLKNWNPLQSYARGLQRDALRPGRMPTGGIFANYCIYITSPECMFYQDRAWTACFLDDKFAVSQQMGGHDSIEKRDWFPTVVEDFFYKNEDLDPDEVADFISTIMDTEFNTLVEDDSDLEVATTLCRFYRMSEAGEKDKIQEELEKMPKYNLDSCMIQDTENETEDDAHEMVTDQLTELQLHENGGDSGSSQCERELTELEKQQAQDEADGWTVQRKGRKRR
ncbi:pre-rRNA-processing protein TSR2 homolog isoform X1 [Penaeus japonicus]|uniref:pre-rRNA-processing protein TSR2 homolog isoform X1 n=1 Tax=Penaeus japonicus TaxID=27405 RepID=UPI001C70C76B|nr:pre-rRNA-processing protein TSR2 homolog isoform X1 [Penaeus japonicus]